MSSTEISECEFPSATPAAASSTVRARLASPPANRINISSASEVIVTASFKPRGSEIARVMTLVISPSSNSDSVTRSERDISGAITEKDGFSVVAATRVTQPFSTPGNSASCCVLLKRCTSSTNSTVETP